MRIRTALFVASALVILGAACSSDDPEEAVTEDSTSATTESGSTETTDEAPGTTTADAPGGDDDAEGFCALLGADDIDVDPTTDEGRALMDEIGELAPSELQEPIAYIFEAFERLDALDDNDPDAIGEVMGLMFDPEFIAAAEALEAYGVDECGFEPGFMDGDGEDDFDFDDMSNPDDLDDPTSLDSMQAWIDDNYGDAEWADAVMSWGMFNGSVSLGGDLDADQALEACEAVVEWMTEIDEVEDIEITDADEAVLVEGADGECAAV